MPRCGRDSRAARAIPPAWPLASSVAVNPFLGQTGETLAQAAARLARVAGSRGDHAARLVSRADRAPATISDADLAAALAVCAAPLRPATLAALKAGGAAPAIRANAPCPRSPILPPRPRASIGRA